MTTQYIPAITAGCITASGQTRTEGRYVGCMVFNPRDCDVAGDYLKDETEGYVHPSTVQ
jgi:hypothetical protein